eukprot:1754268-Rhodomonas_salina.2
MYKLQVEVLKQEVDELQRGQKVDSVPHEYLKEVLIRFILSSPNIGVGPREHEDLVPVLSDLLAFSQHDRERIQQAQEKARGSSILGAASGFLWGS